MIIRRFLQWTATAPADARADGAAALARAYVDGEFDAAECRDAEAVMIALLDDSAPSVRLAMALELASSPVAPHAIVTALAADGAEIAAVVLERSPVFSLAELVDAAAIGGAVAQSAIARRHGVDVSLAAALAEVACRQACAALCANPTATITQRSLSRLLERFPGDADIREVIGLRPDLAPGLRHDMVADTALQLQRFVTSCGWLSPERAARTVREAVEGASIAIGADVFDHAGPSGLAALTDHLRRKGGLTPALILRAALCGNLTFVQAALTTLSGVPAARVSGLLRGHLGLGFDALYGKAGLPAALKPAFAAALQHGGNAGATPQRDRIGRALSAVDHRGDRLGTLTTLLRRLDAEAARDAARAFARDLMLEDRVLPLPQLSHQDRCLPLPSAA